jgi:hypothetical protein
VFFLVGCDVSKSVLVKNQKRNYGPVEFTEGRGVFRIMARVRYDDECGNGHNTFSITGAIDRKMALTRGGVVEVHWREESGGCIHDEIARHFPELKPLLKWHLCSSDGPLHYVANTVYLAGDRDCGGLRAGERRQIVNGRTGLPAWKLEADRKLPEHVDSLECPADTAVLRYQPWCRVGEGKARELDAARRSAVWPEATDDDLTADGLADRLAARLPALLTEFRAAVESLGFVW